MLGGFGYNIFRGLAALLEEVFDAMTVAALGRLQHHHIKWNISSVALHRRQAGGYHRRRVGWSQVAAHDRWSRVRSARGALHSQHIRGASGCGNNSVQRA